MTDHQDSPAPAEAEQAAAGNPVLSLDFYDAEMRPHNEHFRAAADVRPDERVLDIGCGTGQTTREAARSAVNGDSPTCTSRSTTGLTAPPLRRDTQPAIRQRPAGRPGRGRETARARAAARKPR